MALTLVSATGSQFDAAVPAAAEADRQVAGPGSSSAAARRPLKLTRRGKIVLILVPAMVVLFVLLTAIGFVSAPAKASDQPLVGTGAQVVTVLPGDSVWAVAERAHIDRPTGDVVTDIVNLNALKSSVLTPGQQLLVPSK